MPACPGIKRDGTRCAVVVSGPNDYCYQHDPARAAERRRNASRAARSRPSREISAIKAQLQDLAQDVLSGDLETGRAAVVNQLLNTRLRALELERKIREVDELTERLERLEQKEAEQWAG
jgi:flagellar motility protein MotE (MotC chaperone)